MLEGVWLPGYRCLHWGEAVHNLPSQGVPCAALCAFTRSVHGQLLNCNNSFTVVLHLTFFYKHLFFKNNLVLFKEILEMSLCAFKLSV